MQSVSFRINAIENGWFEAELGTSSKRAAVSASNKWGNDAPKHLIKLINQLVSGKILSGYVSFDEAPGTYIVFIDNTSDTTLLYVGYSCKETCHWNEIPTYGECIASDFTNAVPIKEVILFAEIDLARFADSVFKAFDCYTAERHVVAYEKNWTTFPTKDFHKLETLTQKNTYSDLSVVTA